MQGLGARTAMPVLLGITDKRMTYRLYFASHYFREFCEFGGVREIISTKVLRLRPPRGKDEAAPLALASASVSSLDRELKAARSNIC